MAARCAGYTPPPPDRATRAGARHGGALSLSGWYKAARNAGGGATLPRHRLGPVVPVRHGGGRGKRGPDAPHSGIGGRLCPSPYGRHGGGHRHRALRTAPPARGGDGVPVRAQRHRLGAASANAAAVCPHASGALTKGGGVLPCHDGDPDIRRLVTPKPDGPHAMDVPVVCGAARLLGARAAKRIHRLGLGKIGSWRPLVDEEEISGCG